MAAACNSSATHRLLEKADPPALAELFGRYREKLRKMVRLRLDRRLRGRFDSASVVQQVFREATQRIDEYKTNPRLSFFLWLRQLTGECIQRLHRQHNADQPW